MKWSVLVVWAGVLGASAQLPANSLEAVQGTAQGTAQGTVQVPAPPVYRCGNAYSQTPCAQGKVVDTADPRTPEQRAQAQQLNASEARRSAEMRRDRLAGEAAQRAAPRAPAAASLSAAPAAAGSDAAASAASAARKASRPKPSRRKHAADLEKAHKPAGTPFTAREPRR